MRRLETQLLAVHQAAVNLLQIHPHTFIKHGTLTQQVISSDDDDDEGQLGGCFQGSHVFTCVFPTQVCIDYASF